MSQEKQLPHDHHENELAFNFLCANIDNIEDFRIVSDIFKQLGDTTRLRSFRLLCHCDECVQNIAAMINMTSPAISHHLRPLKASGLITSRREGKEVYYRTADSQQTKLLHIMMEQVMKINCQICPK